MSSVPVNSTVRCSRGVPSALRGVGSGSTGPSSTLGSLTAYTSLSDRIAERWPVRDPGAALTSQVGASGRPRTAPRNSVA